MIVIPQLINYRLIIGSLVLTIIVLGSYGFISYGTLKEQTEFLQQEQKLMETELSQMVRLYNNMETLNNNLNAQLLESRNQAQEVLDSLRLIQANAPLIKKYKSQIESLRQERVKLEEQLEDLISQEAQVEPELLVEKLLSERKVSVNIPSIESFQLKSFDAKPFKAFQSGKIVETFKARKVSHFEICFSLSNIFSSEELFIQILNPQNNVIADKGVVNFGNTSLIYSKRLSVNEASTNKTFCESIASDENEEFTKGTYFVSLFNNQKLLANTTIELD